TSAVGELDIDPAFADDPAASAHECGAGPVEPLDLAVVVPVRGDVVTPGEHGVDLELAGDGGRDAGHAPRLGQHLTWAQQRLARHARPVRAFSPDQFGLDDHDRRPALVATTGDVLAR